MKRCKNAVILIFFIVWIFVLPACKTVSKVKTHPDPDTRIKAMQNTLKSLQEEKNVSDSSKKKGANVNDKNDE